MVVEALRFQHLGQVALVPCRLLQLGTFVLEPDLQLVLGEPKLLAEIFAPFLGEVAVGRKFGSQTLKLVR